MTKPEWGAKRVCISCSARFYDMLKKPIFCPKCGEEYVVCSPQKTKRSAAKVRSETPKKVLESVSAGSEDAADSDFLVEDDDALIEDTSDLGEDGDDMVGVIDHVDSDSKDE